MKKKILFIIQYMHTGGAEKSLLALLTKLDYSLFDVDLLLFDHSGVLFDLIPPEVNILPPLFDSFSIPLSKSAGYLLRKGRIRLLAAKTIPALFGRLSRDKGVRFRWYVYKYLLRNTSGKYDIAISYLDFFCNYYVTEKVDAKKRIVYNHMDYRYSSESGWAVPELERRCFSKSDYLIAVSYTLKSSLQNLFPEFAEKILVIHNMISIEAIQKMSMDAGFEDEFEGTRLVTVGRLGEEKGVRLALEACKTLVRQGYNIRWYLIGKGVLKNELEQKIKALGLCENFILKGELPNPYPYMRECDIYVQPSLTEGHCIAVEEAIALEKPIVVTDIPSFREQVIDGETGIITDLSPEGIAGGIKRLIDSDELRQSLSNSLLKHKFRNEAELYKFNKLLTSV